MTSSVPCPLDQGIGYPPAQTRSLRKRALVYLAHVSEGKSMRALSRELGVHPSTIHRQIRAVEDRRDDPLFDEALTTMDRPSADAAPVVRIPEETSPMPACNALATHDQEKTVQREARRILRRLSESKAFLAVAPEAELGVVFRESVPGRPRQTATVPREIAREFAVRDWISCRRRGKVACYEITSAGRGALDRMLSSDVIARRMAHGEAEPRTPFAMQHQEETNRHVMEGGEGRPSRIRVNAAESPLAWLSRRSCSGGDPFLARRELEAGERLREDFERAGLGPNVTQNWQRFLTAGTSGGGGGDLPGLAAEEARRRVSAALKALGPGLSDIAFRCCCFLEGLEAAEKRLGWSKRSGKVVLKIALGRLADHYAAPRTSH
ncbi:MAG: DUF6456 domain-containing protein [Pseudomonadota bacterium]